MQALCGAFVRTADVGVGSKADIKPPMIDVRYSLNSGPSSSGVASTATGASLTGITITGIAVITSDTGISRCSSRLHRHRSRVVRRRCGQCRRLLSVYPSPRSSTPTGFTLLAGSSNQFVTVGTSMLPIAGYRFLLNAPSSAGASVTLVALQAGVG